MGQRADCKGQIKLKTLLAIILVLSQSACFLPYALKQGAYQAELMCGARSIYKIMVKKETSENDKNKLLLITVLRRYAVAHLKMPETKNYTTINPKWHYNLNVVSGSKELAFEPYLWNFPFVGHIPYLGFFDPNDALKEQRSLIDQHYDTMVGQVAAYSTLGYFRDPIWPQMLKRSAQSLSELILHELAHSTLYFTNQSEFNESFANFVGKTGALQFLERNYGSHSPELLEAIRYNQDDATYAGWLNGVHEALAQIYATTKSDEEKRALKKETLTGAHRSFKALTFRSRAFQNVSAPEINNAYVLMSQRYNTGQDDFEKLFSAVNQDWALFYKKLEAMRGDADPFASLQKMVK